MTKFIGLLIFLMCFSLQGEDGFLSDKQLKEIEDKANQMLDSKKIGTERLFYLNLLVARELNSYKKFKWAEKYFKKVISSEFGGDKTEAYLGLSQIYFQNNEKKKLKDNLLQHEGFYKKNPRYDGPRQQDLIKYYHYVGLNNKDYKKHEFGNLKNDILDFTILEKRRKELINEKKYKDALKSLERPDLGTLNVGYKVEYDLLNVVVNKKKIKFDNLYCSKDFKKYPNDWSYPILICSSLKEYLKKGKVSKSNLSKLERYFKKRAQNRKHLLDIVRELQ